MTQHNPYPMPQQTCTGIILAGGESKRLNGREKSHLLVGDQRIIERMMTVFENLFREILVVSNHPGSYLDWDALIVKDLYDKRSSLTGIHASLFYTQTEYAFIAACDTPFLKKGLIKTLVQNIDPRFDVVIPKTEIGIEPLCAVYSRRCLGLVQQSLEKNDLKIRHFFRKLAVKEVPESVLREGDPELISFFNINTPKDLEKANRIVNDNGT